MRLSASRWIKYIAAVVLGNVLYLRVAPHLPPGARHHQLIDWGTFVDLWICVFVYGLIELASFLWKALKRR